MVAGGTIISGFSSCRLKSRGPRSNAPAPSLQIGSGRSASFTPDSTTSRRICYTWQADKEDVFLFSGTADTRSGEDGTNVHGAPATPVFQPYTGEQVIICLLMPAGKPRNISFTLHGHRWRAQPEDPLSTIVPIQGAVSVDNVFNIEPERTKCPGDYLYHSGSLRWDVGHLPGAEPGDPLPLRDRLPERQSVVEKKWYEK